MGLSVGALILAAASTGLAVYQHAAQKKAAKKQRRATASRILEVRPTGSGHPVPVAYGLTAAPGILVYANTADRFRTGPTGGSYPLRNGLFTKNSGKHNEFLLAQYVHAVSPIEGYVNALVDDKRIEGSTISEYSRWQWSNGGASNDMATAFHAERKATDVFTGLAYSTGVFRLRPKDPQFSTMPSLLMVMHGRKIHTVVGAGSTAKLSASRTYSSNAALVLLDYLTSSEFGPGLDVSQINLDSFRKAANLAHAEVQGASSVLDSTVGYPAELNALDGTNYADWAAAFAGVNLTGIGGLGNDTRWGNDLTGIDLRRYECNGLLHTTRDFPTAIITILESMPGAAFFRALDGRYNLVLPDSMTALPTQSVGTIDADILLGPAEWQFADTSARKNRYTAQFTNANREFALDDVTFPAIGSAADTSLQTADGGIVLRDTTDLELTNNIYHGRAIAANEVLQSRRREVTMHCRPRAIVYEPGDVLTVSDPISGFTGFVVILRRQINRDFSVTLTGIEKANVDTSWIATDREALDLQTFDANAVNAPKAVAGSFDMETGYVKITVTPPDAAVIQLIGFEAQARYAVPVAEGETPSYGNWFTAGIADDEDAIVEFSPPNGLHLIGFRARSLGLYGEKTDWTDGDAPLEVEQVAASGSVAYFAQPVIHVPIRAIGDSIANAPRYVPNPGDAEHILIEGDNETPVTVLGAISEGAESITVTLTGDNADQFEVVDV